MLTGPDDVRLQAKTGNSLPTTKMTRLTQSGSRMIGETRHVAQGILVLLPTDIVNSKSRLPQAGEISEQGVQDTVQFKDCWLWFSL
jgi:hypothetical protein